MITVYENANFGELIKMLMIENAILAEYCERYWRDLAFDIWGVNGKRQYEAYDKILFDVLDERFDITTILYFMSDDDREMFKSYARGAKAK